MVPSQKMPKELGLNVQPSILIILHIPAGGYWDVVVVLLVATVVITVYTLPL